MVSTSARNAGYAGSTPVGTPTLFVHRGSMAGAHNPTLLRVMQIWHWEGFPLQWSYGDCKQHSLGLDSQYRWRCVSLEKA